MVQSSPPKSIAELRRLLDRTQMSGMADGSVTSFGIDAIDRWLRSHAPDRMMA
jgi:hypothetical protein